MAHTKNNTTIQRTFNQEYQKLNIHIKSVNYLREKHKGFLSQLYKLKKPALIHFWKNRFNKTMLFRLNLNYLILNISIFLKIT